MFENRREKGIVFHIQKFSIHDGHGIRTLVFLKGCPLKCIWCSNPESQSFDPEILFVEKKCIHCGKCRALCPKGAVAAERYSIERALCSVCGTCVKKCYAEAKKVVGTEMTVEEILEEIEKDRSFYWNSGGGITIGGGEPTAQPEFAAALLQECKRLTLHTAIETCGHGKWQRIAPVLDAADQIFYDLKHMDSGAHEKLTGVGNAWILENAEHVAKSNKEIIFRIPLIPSCNDSEKNIRETGDFIRRLMTPKNKLKVEILPYHSLGTDKYKWLGKPYALDGVKADKIGIKEKYQQLLADAGCDVIG